MVSVVLPPPLPPPSFDELSSESSAQPASSPVVNAATAARAISLRDPRVLVRIASSCCLTCRPPGQLRCWARWFSCCGSGGERAGCVCVRYRGSAPTGDVLKSRRSERGCQGWRRGDLSSVIGLLTKAPGGERVGVEWASGGVP